MPVGFETGVRIHRWMQLIAGEALPVAGYLASTEEPWTANASRRTAVLRQNPPHAAPSRAPREDAPARPSPTVDRARRVAQPPTQIVSGVRARLLPFCCPTSGVHRGGQELPRRIAGVVLDPSNHRAAHSPICRHFENGSDGTRTRDLRRDRPLRGIARWTTEGRGSL